MSNNSITGPLSDFPNTSPKLKVLDLANNQLTGTLQEDLFKLGDLSVLDLAGNHLSGSIPSSIGDLTQLSMLRLSSNSLVGNIPVKLGKLKGRWFLFIAYDLTSKFEIKTNFDLYCCCSNLNQCIFVRFNATSDVSEVLDLSFNKLTGGIPFELSKFQGKVLLGGNADL